MLKLTLKTLLWSLSFPVSFVIGSVLGKWLGMILWWMYENVMYLNTIDVWAEHAPDAIGSVAGAYLAGSIMNRYAYPFHFWTALIVPALFLSWMSYASVLVSLVDERSLLQTIFLLLLNILAFGIYFSLLKAKNDG